MFTTVASELVVVVELVVVAAAVGLLNSQGEAAQIG
jgi:hypothetical protein